MIERPVSHWLFPSVGAIVAGLVVLSFVLSFFDLGGWLVPIGIAIATTQALLIAWFSMELFESRFSVRMLAVIAPLFLILMLSLAMGDLATRRPQPLLVPTPERQGPPGAEPGSVVP